MRKELNDYLLSLDKDKTKIRFFHNDLWSFSSKDLDLSFDLGTSENSIWGVAYGSYLQGYLPVVYGVSFFQIGRFEQLRKFFGFNKAPVLIFNAGAYGYDKYGWEHAFKNNDDINIMKSIGFKVIDPLEDNYPPTDNYPLGIKDIFKEFEESKGGIYVRLPKDK